MSELFSRFSHIVSHLSGRPATFAIAVLLRFVSRYSFGIFAAYRLVLDVVILAKFAARG